jgi:Protein of unknown function (DUF2917)
MDTTLRTAHGSLLHSPLAWLQQLGAGAARAAAAASPTRVCELEDGDTLRITPAQRLQLVCLKGTLWITHDKRPEDHILERGESHVAGANVRVLVTALGDARLALSTLRA